MNKRKTHDFGHVEETGDTFEFIIEPLDTSMCVLVAVVQTERGLRRTEIAGVQTSIWRVFAAAVVKELTSEMDGLEHGKKSPSFQVGNNRLSPLVGRELGVLLITMMEEGAANRVDAILHAWRELAREERWWLYSKAAAPGQKCGMGWRRALFHALSETAETRLSSDVDFQKKKRSGHPLSTIVEAQEACLSKRATIKGRKGKGKKKPAKNDSQLELF